ncbi:hypothetical protein [Tropicibacter sp. S64]|uniref:hypothetical protein n=1 Tax=Tropicibacter sp. S64 TaxID=3415122 RepID=UPI003C7A9848
MSRWFGLGLALLLAFTSVQVAAARGESPAVGTMVICIGQTVMTVAVDADGQPTEGDAHLCPDIALSLFVDAGGGFQPVEPVAIVVTLARDLSEPRSAGRDAPVQQARGPPVLS